MFVITTQTQAYSIIVRSSESGCLAKDAYLRNSRKYTICISRTWHGRYLEGGDCSRRSVALSIC